MATGILLLTLGGCGGPRAENDPPRLVLLGIDGFDWEIIDPLLEQGRLPVMERLLAEGTRADLLTLLPLEKSPVIWTSIATGRLPQEQGRGFLMESGPDSAKAFTSWNRQTRAFWNILPDEGLSVSVLGWLETWPAEKIGGTIVSDYVQYDVTESDKRRRFRHRTYPESLFDEVAPLIRYPKDVSDEQLQALVGRPITDEDHAHQATRRGLDDLRWIYAADLSFTELAREFLEHRAEDVMAIYLRGPDAVCHKFWGEREEAKLGTDTDRVRLFGPSVDRYFVETDRMLGQILEKIDLEKTTLMIVSDHGFRGGARTGDGTVRLGIWMHRELGTVLVAGPAAAGAGLRVAGTRVIDVLPTVLHLLDLPVAEDLDGEVATWLLRDDIGTGRAIRTIATYETGEPPVVPEAAESFVDEQIAERVRALGYVE